MEFFTILVEPKYAGNAGSVARVMKNFGFDNLVMVNPSFSIDDECRKYAVHAQDVIENAIIVSSFKEANEMVDYMVGTTSIESRNDRHHLRKAVLAKEFASKIHKMNGRIGICFGREDYGLLNEEIEKCDLLVKIPTSDEYPSMNLSHAVAVVLYEIYSQKYEVEMKEMIPASRMEKEKMYQFFDQLLDVIKYPEYKKEKTRILFRRVIGRSMLSKWEYHTLMGVFKKAIKAAKKNVK